ncbi:response regulator [Methylobacterium sp. 10]|uniref:response regulator n=1 Tax=Methylobacterium sp. 10 TaxID=1101191 RepID=UPI000481156F|nr:response regulator [Methylobacterium sp. 10]
MSGGDGLRILVVEDEALIALELQCLLEDLGYVIAGVAGSSAEAIELGRETSPDIALVDIHLIDGPTGIEVARMLSLDPRTSVVFMTANDKRIPADFAGALGVIAKPYSERAVAGALRYVAAIRAGGQADANESDGFRPASQGVSEDDLWSQKPWIGPRP